MIRVFWYTLDEVAALVDRAVAEPRTMALWWQGVSHASGAQRACGHGAARPKHAGRWAVNGSSSVSLRQHAYSVFTASRRESGPGDQIPASVRQPTAPMAGRQEARPAMSISQLAGAAPGQVAEPKVTPPALPTSTLAQVSPPPRARAVDDDPSPQRGIAPTDTEIRARAYDRYLARKGQETDPVADWLAAEAELRRERGLA